MDLDDFRSVLESCGVDVWTIIDTAITFAAVDCGRELKDRRDGIIGKLYANVAPVCENCDIGRPPANGKNFVDDEKVFEKERSPENVAKFESPATPVSDGGGDSDNDLADVINRAVEDEKSTILSIREQIHDPEQTEDSLVDLLQTLADMDITFRALQDTDIGRHVNRLRKHPSGEVRRLVKLLVRKWKDIVDEWVSLNTPRDGELQSSALIDGDSPQGNASRNHQNGQHNQVPDFAYSPNPHNGNNAGSGSEMKLKTAPARRDPPTKHKLSPGGSLSSAPAQNSQSQREAAIDPDRFASARKRLQANYQTAQNAKKQRTIQVMDIHEIPKPRNGYIARNKGGFHGRH